MSAAAYPVAFFMRTQRARAHLYADGTAIVQTSTQEFGTGTPTVLTQVAADALGVELRDVRVEFGDTSLPATGSPVGSNGAMMISAAVHNAGTAVRDQLIALAVADPQSPLHGADPAAVTAAGGRLMLAADPGTGETYAALMGRHRMTDAEAIGSWDPPPLDTPYGLLTFGAQFAKVAVDADLGIIRVRHLAGAFAPGRILNPRTARSQLMGGMLWGMSQALLEGNHMDTARAAGPAPASASTSSRSTPTHPMSTSTSSRSKTTSPGRSGSRASARSGRSAPAPRSPTPSTTPPGTASASCPSPSSTCWPT